MREVADFAAGFEELARAGGDPEVARQLAAATGRDVITQTWLTAGYQRHDLSGVDPDDWQRAWVAMFRQISFTINGQVHRRPRTAEQLFRGCGPGGQFGLAWASSPPVAVMFARRSVNSGRGPGRIESMYTRRFRTRCWQ
jgi:hypothetical protein